MVTKQTKDPELIKIAEELRVLHGAHTVILYGSRARGEETPTSDYDVMGVAAIPAVRRDARPWKGAAYLDAFIHPEEKLAEPNASHLYMRGGVILFEKEDFGTRFLNALDAIHARGPTPLPQDERSGRLTWYAKTLERIRRDDPEAHFRRAMLLQGLLEDYFALRTQWYEGPRRALAWLRINDKAFSSAYEAALRPNANLEALEECLHVFRSGIECENYG